ncbi:regulator of Ty1 transposition [Spathaspora passalidarum NRRL Y-27907]|uniref:histone acetyltransferase n=1 Tax=Spathaspora passalidarum (strain NRRL Y-27907 / 11-Y1) TaxID=619300 RepID=G3AJC6_SPAPN|nr:regulator of Ty1 transposition [Spathaspora passalidarum NRRL Y-27907]EGW34585.1 regulator of Ty1 transposition [Spathaspora passalidarum NRRL Y-27907]
MNEIFENISKYLPENVTFKGLYLQSNPVYIKSPIYISKSSEIFPDTVKIRHFISISTDDDITILGIEIFVYLQIYQDQIDQYIFVSKCDTVGLSKVNFKVGSIIEKVVEFLINYDLTKYKIKQRKVKEDDKEDKSKEQKHERKQGSETLFLINKVLEKLQDPKFKIPYYSSSNHPTQPSESLCQLPPIQNIKVCLFTKAAPQYLFPDSAKNPHKHVINGQQLLKWWIPVINNATSKWPIHKLAIPGSDDISTKKFIQGLPNWSIGHIFNTSGPAVYNIALFPDDPKGRFLEHLIVENRYGNVGVDQFYEELGYRQEFRLGDLVGLIGCENRGVSIPAPGEQEDEDAITKLSVHQYKQFINLIKSEDYHIEQDVKTLVGTKIPAFMKKNNINFEYKPIKGKMPRTNATKPTQQAQTINTLTVKRKTNDLTGLIKRKKPESQKS